MKMAPYIAFLSALGLASSAVSAPPVTITDPTNAFGAQVDVNGLHVVCSTCSGGGGASPSASVGSAYPSTVTPDAFKDVATGFADPAIGIANLGLATYVQNSRYQLLGTYGGSGASATGAAVGPVIGNSYIFGCSGTIAGATLQLQVLGPDGATFNNIMGASFTSLPGNIGVVTGSTQGLTAANVKVTVTGATGTPSVWCSLS